MSAFERQELISEIEAFAAELGVTDLTILQKLEDQPDNRLVNFRNVLQERTEELAERVGVLA